MGVVRREEYDQEQYTKCTRGIWDHIYKRCTCDPGWRVAGPTDTFAFLKGQCTQSECKSDAQCTADLHDVLAPGDNASCVHTGWNCYCGWYYAGMSSLTGAENERAKCMGVVYVMSISGGRAVWWFMSNTWLLFLGASFLCLPCGQTHVRCQHRNPDMLRLWHPLLKQSCYCPDTYAGPRRAQQMCDGSCTGHPISNWFYTFSWSIYIIDYMVVLYAILTVMYMIFLVSWAIAMWLVVAVICIIACIVAAVGALIGSCGGCSDNCECHCSGDTMQCDGCCVSNPDGCSAYRCDCCCTGASPSTEELLFYNTQDFYIPSTSSAFYSQQCSLERACHLCRPLAWIISKFPRAPANAWGGLIGWLMGTNEGGAYAGGNPYIDFLSFRSVGDAHNDTDWRDAVATFIYSYTDSGSLLGRDVYPIPQPDHEPTTMHGTQTPLLHTSQAATRTSWYGKTLIQSPSSFTLQDNVVSACFEDYTRNECWICCACNGNTADIPVDRQWHLWIDCGHMFCHQCSAEMSRRRMPCPLCRRFSSRIKEGPRYAS